MPKEVHGDGERILIVAHAAVNQVLFHLMEKNELKHLWNGGRQQNRAVATAVSEGEGFSDYRAESDFLLRAIEEAAVCCFSFFAINGI